MIIKINDELYEQYQKMATNGDVEKTIEFQLKTFADVKPGSRIWVLSNKERVQIEKLLGKSIDTGADLIKELTKALKVRVDGVELEVSPDTLALLHAQAKFEGADEKAFTKQKLEESLSLAVNGW